MNNDTRDQKVRKLLRESLDVQEKSLNDNLASLFAAADAMSAALKSGGKVIFFGNGGSAADSQHLAAELIGRFQKDRKALAAISLTTDTSILTSLSNDYSFDIVFARQLEGLGKPQDVAIGLSTSGNSANVIRAIQAAKTIGMTTIAMTGHGGGRLAELADIAIIVPSKITARVQEAHITLGHMICELVEDDCEKK